MPQSIKEKIKALEQTNRLITENLIDAVWVIDADTWAYEYVTPSILKITGYTADELIGTMILDRLTPESAQRAQALLASVVATYQNGQRTSHSIEIEAKLKNGDTYWCEVRAKLIEEADGLLKIVGITRDITARRKTELALERVNQELSTALADRDRLLRELRVLHGLLPICSGCKRIRDEADRWWPLEEYVRRHTNSEFTHTICPDCKDIFYPRTGRRS